VREKGKRKREREKGKRERYKDEIACEKCEK